MSSRSLIDKKTINGSSVFSTRRSGGRRRRRASEGWNIRNGHTASWQSGVNNQEVTAYPVLTSNFRLNTLSPYLPEKIGAARGIRTPDPIITNDLA